MNLNESYRFYELTLLIAGSILLIVGLTLLILCPSHKQGRIHNKAGLVYLAASILALSMINLAEYVLGCLNYAVSSFSLVVFAASAVSFLLFFAYVSMLNRMFATPRRLCAEIVLIVLFTIPPLFADGTLFDVLFVASLAFYFIKLVWNVVVYRRYLHQFTDSLENPLNRESFELLNWMNCTFPVALTIATLSIIAPLTNYIGLAIYNSFVVLGCLYIYIEAIRNIQVFDRGMEAWKPSDGKFAGVSTAVCRDKTARKDISAIYSFMDGKQEVFDKWISGRGYGNSDLTAEDVATQLGTSRDKLSSFLNDTLKMNYYEWLALLRIEDAKKQLVDYPNRSVAEIGKNVGIDDRSNFGRTFRRVMNMTPADYRERMKSTGTALL